MVGIWLNRLDLEWRGDEYPALGLGLSKELLESLLPYDSYISTVYGILLWNDLALVGS